MSDLSMLAVTGRERTEPEWRTLLEAAGFRLTGVYPVGSDVGVLEAVPDAHIVNAAFSHPGPNGDHFHNSQRGAWYAGVAIETSISEVAFHKRRFLTDSRMTGEYSFDYVDFLADFSGSFHQLEPIELQSCLQPDPVPQCYGPSQALATALLFEGSNGIVYPSARHHSGVCIACFRPALVFHPRRGDEYRIKLETGTEATPFESISSQG